MVTISLIISSNGTANGTALIAFNRAFNVSMESRVNKQLALASKPTKAVKSAAGNEVIIEALFDPRNSVNLSITLGGIAQNTAPDV